MARIRAIKPEFWSSPSTASCEDPWARLLFLAMWNWADDAGRGTAIPKELAGFAFPNEDKIDSAEIRRMLGGIRRAFGVEFYKVDGRPYYAIPSWNKHQKIDRRSEGKYPGPEAGDPWNPDPDNGPDQPKRHDSAYSADPSAESHESSPSPRRVLGAGTGEQGNRGRTTLATADAAPDTDEGFAEFWAAYPRKEKKPTAARAYKTLRRRHITHDTIMAGLRRHTTAWQAAGKERQYIPHPASWLNSEAFNDDLEQTALSVVPAFETSFDQIRAEADAEYAGRVINRWYVEPAQPPSDPTPQQCWTRDRAVEFIDAHETAIRAALPAPRRTG